MRQTATLLPAPIRALAAILAAMVLAALVPAAPVAAQTRTTLERIAGVGGVEISASVSQRFTVDTDTVVIARADAYPDALAGAPLAKLLDAPILLVPQSAPLPAMIFTELDRLRPQRVLILGGTAAIEQSVADAISGMGIAVDRIGGATRFHTAQLIGEEVVARTGATHAYLVRGAHTSPTGGWPDAVAVSALAAQRGHPILLTDQSATNGPTRDLLANHGFTDVTVVGGTGVIDDAVVGELTDIGYTAVRESGASRFDTSVAIARAGFSAGASMGDLFLVTGGNYVDALVTAVAAGQAGGTMLLVDGRNWQVSAARNLINERFDDIEHITVVGSPNDVPVFIDHELVDRTVAAPPTFNTSGAVRINVGQHIQSVINNQPPGTTFVIASGVHRGQDFVPRSGDIFIGEPGAVLNGAVPLDPAVSTRNEAGQWVIATPAVTPQPIDPAVEMEPGHEREAYPNELWAGYVRLRHVNYPEEVNRPGTWYMDYERNEVLIFDDPRALPGPLEFSITPEAIRTLSGVEATDVVIRNLTVTHYANRPSRGVLDLGDALRWDVGHVTVIDNHAVGIRTGAGLNLHDSRIVRNGQMGVVGTDHDFDDQKAPLRIVNNEVAMNGELGFVPGWEGGSIKLGETDGAQIVGNWVHNHPGSGPWIDEFGTNTRIAENLIEHNDLNGVMHEISWNGTIVDNVIRYNGLAASGDSGAGVWVSNSPNVEVGWNVIEGNRLPINAQSSNPQTGREAMPVEDLLVHTNDIRVDYLLPGMRVTSDADYLYANGNNGFQDNRYRLNGDDQWHFWWGDVFDVAGWKSLGFDLNGEFTDITEDAMTFSDRPGFAPRTYGAS